MKDNTISYLFVSISCLVLGVCLGAVAGMGGKDVYYKNLITDNPAAIAHIRSTVLLERELEEMRGR